MDFCETELTNNLNWYVVTKRWQILDPSSSKAASGSSSVSTVIYTFQFCYWNKPGPMRCYGRMVSNIKDILTPDCVKDKLSPSSCTLFFPQKLRVIQALSWRYQVTPLTVPNAAILMVSMYHSPRICSKECHCAHGIW